MYNDNDLENAAAAGILSPDTVAELREYVAAQRHFSRIDEEHYRVFDGSNDAFVAVGCVLAIAGLANLAYLASPVLAGIVGALGSWGLAEYFVRRRRLSLTGIILTLVFVLSVIAAFILAIIAAHPTWGPKGYAGAAAIISLIVAAVSWAFANRLRVPYAFSFVPFFVACVVLAIAVLALVDDHTTDVTNVASALAAVALLCGLGIFAYAMKWDLSDPLRVTERHEIALWIHGAAGGMIVQPLFYLLGVSIQSYYFVTVGQVLTIVVLYTLFVLVGLAIDRRALPFAALMGLLYALAGTFLQLGADSAALDFTGIVAGGGILLLSVFWHPARAAVVPLLGRFADLLPPVRTSTVED